MDKKSKIFFAVFALMIAGSVAVTYWRIVVKRNYLVLAETACDPETETCFVYECDPEEGECTGDPEEDTSYYAKIKKKAFNFPECENGECPDPVCEEGESDCEVILCDEENKEEWESCNDPEEYKASLEEAEDEEEDGDSGEEDLEEDPEELEEDGDETEEESDEFDEENSAEEDEATDESTEEISAEDTDEELPENSAE